MSENRKKVCVVVGVGPGLGLAVADRFGREGYHLALMARQRNTLDDHTTSLRQKGYVAHPFPVDVTDLSSLVTAFQSVNSTLGIPDVLVYNAALLKSDRPRQLTASDALEAFRVNVVGALVSVQQVLPGMEQRGSGTVLFTGGGSALHPSPDYTSLGMGKAALRHLCFSLAQELAPAGIHIATVTIAGAIQPGTHFDPDKIAEQYWALHAQQPCHWQQEVIYQ